MDKSKKRIVMVAIVLVLLIGGYIATCATALKWIAILVAGWIAFNPGFAACGVIYEPSSQDPPFQILERHGHFGASVNCGIIRGQGYYEGGIAARGTLQMQVNNAMIGDRFHGIVAYAESGIFSSSGRISGKLSDGRWVIVARI